MSCKHPAPGPWFVKHVYLTEVGATARQEKSLYDECRAQSQDALGILTIDSQSRRHFGKERKDEEISYLQKWLSLSLFSNTINIPKRVI